MYNNKLYNTNMKLVKAQRYKSLRAYFYVKNN